MGSEQSDEGWVGCDLGNLEASLFILASSGGWGSILMG